MGKKERWELSVGLLAVSVIAILVLLSLKLGLLAPTDTVKVWAYFHDASGLIENADIMIAGVKVGKVGGLTIERRQAKVELLLRKSLQIRADCQIRIRSRSLLGDKFVEVIPGSDTAPILADNDMVTNTLSPVEFDQLLYKAKGMLESSSGVETNVVSVLANMETLVSRLANLMDARGDTMDNLLVQTESIVSAIATQTIIKPDDARSLLTGLRETITAANTVLQTDRELVLLIKELQTITHSFSARAPTLAVNLDETLAAAVALRPALEETLQRLNSVLVQAQSLLPRIDGVIGAVESKQGALGRLIYEDELYQDLAALIKDLREHPWKLVRKN